MWASASLGGGWPAGSDHGGKRLRGGVAERDFSRKSVRDSRRNRSGADIPSLRADRKRFDETRRSRRIDPQNAAGKRSEGGNRRFWYRLLELGIFAKVSARCSQDRPILRPSDRHRRRGYGDSDRGDRHGPGPQAAGHRGGGRNAGRAGISSGSP